MKTYSVYILKCSDQSYYTGVTNNLARRLEEHHLGINPESYTYGRRPLELVFYQTFHSIRQAIAFEKQVKGWSRKKKQAIINDHWEQLKDLAACKNETTHLNMNRNSNEVGFDSAQPDNN